MIRIAKIYSNTNGNSQTVRSVFCITMSLLMLKVIEMMFAELFFSTKNRIKIFVVTKIK
jgi:hypothetical protein